jgi:non-ribosomal peptide synthetase component F
MPSPQGHLVHHQFMRQAAAHPDAPCLIFEGQVLTYSQVSHVNIEWGIAAQLWLD